MLSCMTCIEWSSAPVSSSPPDGNCRFELPGRDAVGHQRRGRKRPHDAAGKKYRDRCGDQQRKHRHADHGIFEAADLRDGLAAADEAMIGIEFDQKIELIEDLLVERSRSAEPALLERIMTPRLPGLRPAPGFR